jgi:hypothetical protein
MRSVCSQAHILAGWRLESRLFSTELFFITTLHELRRKHSLSFVSKAYLQRRCIETEVIDCCLRIRCRGMCLPSRCLAMNIYSHFTIPTFGHRVTISSKKWGGG